MKTLGNIIWIIFGGLEWCVGLLIAGVFACATIIGIPIGVQLFQLAGFVLWPFGKRVVAAKPSDLKSILNIVWAILFGWEFAIAFLFTGILFCFTIIGIPFGKQYFKIAQFALLPLGHKFK